MLSTVLILIVIVAILGTGLRSERRRGLIARRPYNNPYGDATAARDRRY